MVTLRQLVSPKGQVPRARYLRVGLSLFLFKYVVDLVVYRGLFGDWWGPLDYLSPLYSQRMASAPDALDLPIAYAAFLLLWNLIFAWIGANWTARRAVDAGETPWWGLMIFVPFLNYLAIGVLALMPSTPKGEAPPVPGGSAAAFQLPVLLVWGMTFFLAMACLYWTIVEMNEHYGIALFLSFPVLFGVLIGYSLNAREFQSVGRTVGFSLLCAVAASVILLSASLEGLVCIAMAFPVISLGLMVGALIGRSFVGMGARRPLQPLGMLFALPFIAWSDANLPTSEARQVTSSIEIDAPPEVVWENVVSFPTLPDPTSWIFKTGIAYPIGARIEGRGVGAVRRCEFSTGAFVEPITVWDAPRHLAFDVLDQPETMTEWGLFGPVHPPHLESTFRSVRGEFRLVELPGGRTRLEGSTWYELDMAPEVYWRIWGDGVVQHIHGRVLGHIQAISEASSE
ncbi:Polyketide cyclase / dehydrase and lipid transport [Planctomycetes bacterium Poly30]|uniref:Polyketide cyclase / dehydrase and lipid transport n=1 Tax=Saltatorellus ferox TaxID=2528018 RepID=A0A518EZP5_9BACT|nr:Polyketide cyclase / dehydrase and lipid transport [Planctomycetes bacterium Poly30]